ncbi:hypothetical protein F4677DRAFT_454930 [Hypoxylon crocopeplum]|nr:hypothetical protein F4677DRAFT_454930 [Hypoxylon crocopeplum]
MSSAEAEQTKPTRVFACAMCKQRRVKCSRSFPCTNCVRAGVPCMQPTVNQRRRRFAERELLDRLHHYEDILRQNNIAFEPLHGSASATTATADTPDDDDTHSAKRNKDKEAIDVWQTIKRMVNPPPDIDPANDDDDDGDESDGSYDNADQHVKEAILANDHLLFGAPSPDFHLAASHPEQGQVFRLWQIYLDNVNPLLKVTHTPTMQPRIIDAACDVENISPALEALIFSIYCVAVLSLTDDECRVSFRLSRDYLLAGYQVACKQALLKCSPWRSNDRDCLTALYLYLVSVGPQVDPRSLACMVAVAIRIAQRMGMHCESSYNTRLWWSLVLFDHRICEIVGQERSTALSPTWDCHPPLNVNDFEMRVNMGKAPAKHDTSETEALFAVVRSELADFVRHSVSHLTIIGGNPSPGMFAQSKSEGSELKALETTIEDKYLAHFNVEVPLHYMTIWTTRSFLARSRLIEHYLTHGTATSERPTDVQRRIAFGYALRMVECDTQLRTSPLTKGYLWLVESGYSPVLAYFHILNGLAKRPGEKHADKAWSAMCDNYEALVNGPKHHRTRLMFALKFSRITLQAWEAREALLRQQNSPSELPPRLVLDATMNVMQMSSSGPSAQSNSLGEQSISLTPSLSLTATNSNPMPLMFPTPLDTGDQQISGEGRNFAVPAPAGFPPNMSGQAPMDLGMDQFWTEKAFKWI